MRKNEILRVEHLSVSAAHGASHTEIIRDVSFTVAAGEVFCIVGESGSGKTTLACALARLSSPNQYAIRGNVTVAGKDLLSLSDAELRTVLRSHMRYLFQEPGQSFDPIARIASQIGRAFEREPAFTRRLFELFTAFGLDDHDGLLASYPHELSIGTLQRIHLAMALAPGPKLLVADEPTSAIDSLVKYQMMDAIRTLTAEEGLAVVFITHDLTLARLYSDRTVTLSNGRFAEH